MVDKPQILAAEPQVGKIASAIDPRSIVNAMIEYARPRGLGLTHLAIQKLLYFAHGLYLVRYEKPLVSGSFEAWEFGPVHRTIYDALKHSGRSQVYERLHKRDPFSGEISPIELPQDWIVKDHISEVMKTWGGLSAGHLVDVSHAKDGPWHYVWERAKYDPILGNKISDSITIERFVRLKVSVSNSPRCGDVDYEAAPYFAD